MFRNNKVKLLMQVFVDNKLIIIFEFLRENVQAQGYCKYLLQLYRKFGPQRRQNSAVERRKTIKACIW